MNRLGINGDPAVIAVVGLSTVEIIKLWQSLAPSLAELRTAEPGNIGNRQRLMDADYMGAGLAVLVGGTCSLLLHSWLPIIVALGSVVMYSQWHHMVLNSGNDMFP